MRIHTLSSQNKALVSNFNKISDVKVNLIGTFERSTFQIPSNFQKCRENRKQNIPD